MLKCIQLFQIKQFYLRILQTFYVQNDDQFIIITLKTMNSQSSYLNCYSKHNHQKDKLYPLLNALIKAKCSLQPSRFKTQIANSNQMSLLIPNSHRILTPKEADDIMKTLHMPIDRELVPTHNFEKVAGKNFYILDVEQHQRAPLSSSQVDKIHKQEGSIEKIVYEFKENNRKQRKSLLQSRHKKQKISLSLSRARFTEKTTNDDSRRYQALKQTKTTQQQPRSTIGLQSGIKVDCSRSTISNSNGERLLLNNGVKQYKFNPQMKDAKRKSFLKMRDSSEYKYNLFSVLDEFGNNGIKTQGCMPGNQLIAAKLYHKDW